MRICRIAIKNFANFEDVEFATHDDIVVVGENKAGKSNLIRALRLILDPSLPDRDRLLGFEQFWDGLDDEKLGASVTIEVDFTDFEDDPALVTVLADCLVETTSPAVARLTYRFQPKASLEGEDPESLADYEFIIFGGTDEDNAWSASDRREMPLDVLPALRDAESDLMSWRRSPLRPVIEELAASLDDDARKDIQDLINNTQSDLAGRDEVKEAAQKVADRLEAMVGAQHAVTVDLGIAPTKVDTLLRNLRVLIDDGVRGVGEASLGTANLLFLALKSLELDRVVAEGERSHTFFAVEEPEAHLHPHVQRLVYRHFLGTENDEEAATNVTTILTTHSPHIASVAPVRSIVLLREDVDSGSTCITSAAAANFTPEDEADLQRYIDVTRGEIFFARGIIFVEGDAERFLIPAFAKALGMDLDALGVTVCSVSGTNFLPYIKLVGPEALQIPFVVLTDYDSDSVDETNEPLAYSRVRDLLIELGQDEETLDEYGVGQLFEEAKLDGIFVNESTLEVELFDAGMGDEMAQVFSETIPWTRRKNTMQKWLDEQEELNEKQLLGWIKLIGKGRFAQMLAALVSDGTCPQYIRDALTFVKNGFSPVEL